jgi:archaellum component FlaC
MSVKEKATEHTKIENIQSRINKVSDDIFLIQTDLANFKKAVSEDLEKIVKQLSKLIKR